MSGIKQLLIIGYGNMSGAMLAGWLAAGEAPERFAILNRSPKSAPDGVKVYRDIADAVAAGGHDAVMLGFKPQQLGDVAPELQALTGGGVEVYSLLAGLTLAQLKSAFPHAEAHIRVMPNLASRINKSPIILLESGLVSERRDSTFGLFDALGTAVWLDDEDKFDLVTALAGSGPGFVYRFIDALASAAIELGIEAAQAEALAVAMVDGASSLAAGEALSPGDLADRVASPGGMTREGMNVLDADQALHKLLVRTLKATAERGAELSAGNG
ncbi:pyrroline-5-carboxylate reductase dimerization domain-containing protein [Erythrobacter sp. F6033]|uniref:pyrroline-5-carboxylate reductase family protein n=1 Tax=Erythrobacter sp. F6033 TaxID=2926401 RepID=UPI001FF3D672|nr:pyrroline-5-carboxylate reductase dimerization domain-containing protein [Erythrobacter sp. F6033]MCK0129003.1 NAD(P)-binding domain-containing protein [Erythrobacter sp. F6033]